jgi:hypothetical protein
MGELGSKQVFGMGQDGSYQGEDNPIPQLFNISLRIGGKNLFKTIG